MNTWFLMAGIVSFFICLLHIVGGGKIAARPLLASKTLGTVAKYTNYYCWHIVTIVLAALGGMYVWAAFHIDAIDLAIVATGLVGAFMMWSFGIVALNKWQFLSFPQWLLFAIVLVIALPGIF